MPEPATALNAFQLRSKLRITGTVVFDTAWRIGSGKEGETMSDLGVVLDPGGQPVLPGSSLRGKLRSTCETLAHALDLTACLLNVSASGVKCVSDVKYYAEKSEKAGSKREEYRRASERGLTDRLNWIDQHTCDVCKLFGSPLRASQLRISDGILQAWANVVQVRDGVVLDRDSHTAVDGLKYDYEVVPAGSEFRIMLDLDNPSDTDLALLGAALFEWHAGSSVGGFTSRGLGRFRLLNIKVAGVNFDEPKQRIQYLTKLKPEERLSDLGGWDTYFTGRIETRLGSQPAGTKEAQP
jgi:CRISPR-associated RAMP protein (TIGR02581 family)